MVQSIYNTVCLPNNIQHCALHNIFIIQVCMVVWKCVKTDPFHLPSPILRHFASYPTYSFFSCLSESHEEEKKLKRKSKAMCTKVALVYCF